MQRHRMLQRRRGAYRLRVCACRACRPVFACWIMKPSSVFVCQEKQGFRCAPHDALPSRSTRRRRHSGAAGGLELRAAEQRASEDAARMRRWGGKYSRSAAAGAAGVSTAQLRGHSRSQAQEPRP
eukprot:364213-Chlamydomonas_euryale.AAC.13